MDKNRHPNISRYFTFDFFRQYFEYQLKRLGIKDSHPTITIKRKLSLKLYDEFNGIIRYGPLTGVKIKKFKWSTPDLGSILLGIYEKEIIHEVVDALNSNNKVNFFHIGSSDGILLCGLSLNGYIDKGYSFEKDFDSRNNIIENLKVNNINNIELFPNAEPGFLLSFEQEIVSDSVILIDVEGYEYELIDDNFLIYAKNSVIIIEIHDFNSVLKLNKEYLLERTKQFHNQKLISLGSRNPFEFSEIDDWFDDEKWLLMSESRPAKMEWLILEPKESLDQ